MCQQYSRIRNVCRLHMHALRTDDMPLQQGLVSTRGTSMGEATNCLRQLLEHHVCLVSSSHSSFPSDGLCALDVDRVLAEIYQ